MIKLNKDTYKFVGIKDGRAYLKRMKKTKDENNYFWNGVGENVSYKINFDTEFQHHIIACEENSCSGRRKIRIKDLLEQWDFMREYKEFSEIMP